MCVCVCVCEGGLCIWVRLTEHGTGDFEHTGAVTNLSSPPSRLAGDEERNRATVTPRPS